MREVIKHQNIYNIISPAFYDLHDQIQAGTTPDNIWLEGGRGSTKSSFAFIEIIDGIMRDPLANAVVYRKVADTLRNTTYEQCKWAMDILGVTPLWKLNVNPLRMTYPNPETGQEQRILFQGADKATNTKGSMFSYGVCKYLIYEEAEQFSNADEMETITVSWLRGDYGDIKPLVFYCYNPPKFRGHWLNKHVVSLRHSPNDLVHHSTFVAVANSHPEWLGEAFLRRALALKKLNPNRYRHVFLGEDVMTGNEVFPNLEYRPIDPSEYHHLTPHEGFDEGYTTDPSVWLQVYYDRKRDTLYIVKEVFLYHAKTKVIAETIRRKQEGKHDTEIKGDSANPRVLDELEEYGLYTYGVKKGKGSVDHGIKWLSDRTKIVISEDCPKTFEEFNTYAIAEDARGNQRSGFPDKNNHSIDTCRYALEDIIAGQDVVF
ncbi:gp2 [Listeria phage P40]|uniref:terminase large subunit n=1 Tax=Listeria phage P40 TaxID=560178 RepID=UPI00018198B9|nr:terminase large subunit [Listeria phage P40]ACI00362.1 gp2 [Listeria phage P40]